MSPDQISIPDDTREPDAADPAAGVKSRSVVIAALGGEGGGVLTDWIVRAAMESGFPVQSTSIPGVAQRTGATTYYVEFLPVPYAELGGRRPLFGLYPVPGEVDVVVASEILEAGRAMERGFASPDRTTLIASTHRVYAISEKSAMADGRFDHRPLEKAIDAVAKRSYLMDIRRIAEQAGGAPNAVMLGILSGSGALPIAREVYEASIRATGKMVDSNLAAFRAGFDLAAGGGAETLGAAPIDNAESESGRAAPTTLGGLRKRVWAEFPADIARLVETGLERVVDFQDIAYGRRYLDRLAPVLAAERAHGGADGFPATRETARFLALWMSYEDIVKVADLKTRAERFDRVRGEVRAAENEPVQLTEFFKPGVEEVAALLTPGLGRRLMALADRRGWIGTKHVRMRIRTHTVFGFLRLWLLARLRVWRPRTFRFAEEQALIERWLSAVIAGTERSPALGTEIARCAKLIKGYSDTHRRGWSAFHLLMDRAIDPLLADDTPPVDAVARIGELREAALADPSGIRLRDMIDGGTLA
ncbi:indolepyruvate oxidoreductase subunit beta family protein [Fodinicurvata sp. EGI_FJ10296]|uniref:indolepyruvate oxidoreductase subunit beta family protein n=1 Tax=Fodinicurvata sp. EGI_FJ10296 TaxID=3231908 RepID=UPI003452D923